MSGSISRPNPSPFSNLNQPVRRGSHTGAHARPASCKGRQILENIKGKNMPSPSTTGLFLGPPTPPPHHFPASSALFTRNPLLQETDYPVTNAMSSCNRPSQQCSLYDQSVAAQLINKHRGQIQLVNKVNTSHASFCVCVCTIKNSDPRQRCAPSSLVSAR